ncbi:MAG: protein translocase subunit SecD [Firmicutes bacterium]|nr:protein translocase subunit SecD [Bacillota bacterium]
MKKLKNVLILMLVLVVIACTTLFAFIGAGSARIGINKIHLGLDLAGGVTITYQAKEANPRADQMEGALAIINNRLSSLGYTEATAFQDGLNRIRVEIPGVSDANEAVRNIGKTAMLTFVGVDWSKVVSEGLIDDYIEPLTQQAIEELKQQGTTSYSETTIRSNIKTYLSSPGSAHYYFPNEASEILQKAIDKNIAEIVLYGENVADATPQHGQTSQTGMVEDYVKLELDSTGAKQFADATTKYRGLNIAIRLDQNIVSIPSVSSTISDGIAIITGMNSVDEAKQLAADIRGGALPVELEDIEHNSVGATLGRDALSTSLKAGLIGFLLVLIFMIIIYRVPGVVASLSLIFYVGAEILLLNLFNVTLTLPGIAGILLSIGMAVDANIVIYARINEEIRSGRGLRAAVTSGFRKALSAILDGNITTLIAAAVLWFLGSGSVKGFALTLAIGIVLSMFTALVLSNLLLKQVVEVLPENNRLYTSIQFLDKVKSVKLVEKTRIWLIIPAVIVAIGLVFMIVRGMNLDTDFAGGTMVQIDMEKEYDNQKLTQIVKEQTGDTNPMVQALGGTVQQNQVQIKVKEISTEQIEALYAAIAREFGLKEDKSNLISQSSISPTISGEMQRTAITATLVATILMLIYITIRFRDWRFGLSSIIALLHDVLIVMAVYAVFYIPVNSNFIAALLTIVGYSINNTIVVFDRIRENQRFYRPYQLNELANDSIVQTMGRSLNTSITTVIMVLMIFIMGVDSIRWFAFPLLAGFIAGTYSSLFVASPVWVLFKKVGAKGNKKPARAAKK